MLAALRSRDYRRFWLGSLASSLGVWIQTIALGWLVYDLTRSASWLGTVGFCGNLPMLALGLLGGAIADRASRRVIMTASLVVLALGAATLALLTAIGHISVWHVIAVAMVSGVATALYTPAMHAIVPSLVEPEHLFDAISLNSVQFNLARAVGPALAGLLYVPIGPQGCFALNACGFLGMAVVVGRLQLPPRTADASPPMLRALREGLGYVRRHPVIGPAIFLAAVLSLFGFPYIIMLPAVARDTLSLDATGLGYLMTCVGVGAVVGGLAVSAVGDRGRGGRTAVAGAVLFGIVLSGFAVVRTVPATMVLLLLLGAVQTVAIASMVTTIQTAVHDGMRGRVMSMVTVLFFGLSTVGGLVAGLLGDRVGVPLALASGGVVTAAVAMVLARSPAFA
ncbi:MAG: MFS transporter [Candidatus Binatia bacterium]